MKLKRKKGFTLVELLVVIAILAILAAVSVVGYLGFTNKAKESNDISLTTQMNTILQGESTLEGANKTAHDAVLDLQENGLDVTKLTPTRNGYEFVYDLSQDKFFLLDDKMTIVAPEGQLSTKSEDIFVFVGESDTLDTKYSNYLKDDFKANGALEISTGLDVGSNTTVSSVNYTNTTKKAVMIRTNGGTLTINGPEDTVHHYGSANVVNVTAVDPNNSYHEFGTVTSLNVEEGNIVLENSSSTNTLEVTSTDKSVTITNKGNVDVLNIIGNSSTSVTNENTVGTLIADETQSIDGNKPTDSTITEIKTLTAETHEITEGGYYDGNGITINGIKNGQTYTYGLRITTNDPVIINNVVINADRCVIATAVDSFSPFGSYNMTLNNVNLKVTGQSSSRGIGVFYEDKEESRNSVKIKLNNSSVVSTEINDYDTKTTSGTYGLMLNNIKESLIELNHTNVYGLGYSVMVNNHPTFSHTRNENNTFNIENCNLKGRAGVEAMASYNNVFNIKNTSIHGINTFTGSTERFGNFVLDDGENTTINLENSKFTIYRAPATIANGQAAFNIRSTGHKLNIIGNNTMVADIYYTSEGILPETSQDLIDLIFVIENCELSVNGKFTESVANIHQNGEFIKFLEWY